MHKHRTKETILVLCVCPADAKGVPRFQSKQILVTEQFYLGGGFFPFNPYTHIVLMIKIRYLKQQMALLIL